LATSIDYHLSKASLTQLPNFMMRGHFRSAGGKLYQKSRNLFATTPLRTTTTAWPWPSIQVSSRSGKRFLSEKSSHSSKENIPPLLLYPTASPSVFVSSAAIDMRFKNSNSDANENENSEMQIHPKSLFQEIKPPKSFQSSRFRYISPKEFNHELPDAPIPEIAFLGKSNVGKSSLLNALTQKHLAKTSKTPGRTQQVNYFGLFPYDKAKHISSTNKSPQKGKDGSRHRLGIDVELPAKSALGYIIDLPGYGYAKAPDATVEMWQDNTQKFIQQRIEMGNLQRIYLLVDARRGLHLFDRTILAWLDEAQVNYTIILTKCDTVSRPKLIKFANEICMRYHAQAMGSFVDGTPEDGRQSPFVHLTSSKNKKVIGIMELMWALEADFYQGAHDLRLRQLNYGRDPANGWDKIKSDDF